MKDSSDSSSSSIEFYNLYDFFVARKFLVESIISHFLLAEMPSLTSTVGGAA